MAGHSKWSKARRNQGAIDVKRGRLLAKLSKEITVMARLGSGDLLGFDLPEEMKRAAMNAA